MSREEETTVNWYVIVTWLLWKFSIFKNPIGKTLIRKYHPNFFSFSENSIYAWRVKHYQYFVNQSIQIFKFEHFSTLFEQVWSKKPKLFGSDEVWQYRLIGICRILLYLWNGIRNGRETLNALNFVLNFIIYRVSKHIILHIVQSIIQN